MLFSTVLIWLLVAVAFLVALPALWLLSLALWPAAAARGRDAAASGLWKLFLFGLVPTVVGVFLVILVANTLRNGALSVLVAGLCLTVGFIGAGGIATLVGERLWPDSAAEPWRQTQRGGLVLVCCALLPVIGWILLLPLIAVLGWGIQVRSFLAGRKAKSAVSAAEAAA